MNQTFIRSKIESSDSKWLAFIALSAITTMILGIENAFENRVAFALFALFTLAGMIAKGLGGVGLTTKNLARGVLVGTGVGIVYGTLRGLLLKFVPSSQLVLGADLALLAPRLETGISIGPLLFTSEWLFPFWLFLLPGMITMELYFRGVLFLTLKKHIHWTGALAVASIVQAISRRTPHSLIMGSLAGIMMQRYGNILAPSFMHAVQWLVATAILLHL